MPFPETQCRRKRKPGPTAPITRERISGSRLSPGLRIWGEPTAFVASGAGLGLLPWAPGTWASLAALPCAWVIAGLAGKGALAIAAVVAFAVGCWAAGEAARRAGQDDPGWIVIDEIAAQWLVLVAAPLDWHAYIAGFLLFRLFDIAKPWPVRAVDRGVKGGFGVMLDDIAAALYALVLLLIGEGIFGVRL